MLALLCAMIAWVMLAVGASAAAPLDEAAALDKTAAPEKASAGFDFIADTNDPLSTELSEAEQAHVDRIADEVRRIWQDGPKTELPAAAKWPSANERTRRYNDWIASLYAEAWRVHGDHDARWDERAAALLRDFAQPTEKAPPKWETRLRAYKLMREGCDDPLVRFVYAQSFDLGDGTAVNKTVAVLEPALNKLGADYSPEVAYRIELRYVEAHDRMYRNRAGEPTPTVDRMLARIASIASGELDDEQRRRLLKRTTADLAGPLDKYMGPLFKKLAAAPKADRWLVQMLLARAHLYRGWQARGGGYANTVTPEGWRSLGAHLTKARALLLQAWSERPELPEAAAVLITITTASDGAAGEGPRFWFDRAVQADFDLVEAYHSLLWALRPRWGGSHEQMLAFGRECLATKRFDLHVPWIFHKALCDVISEADNPRDVCSAKGVYDDYLALLDGGRAQAEKDGKQDALQSHFDSTQACIAWLAGRDDESRQILKRLGDDVDVNVFGEFHVTLSDARLALDGGQRAPPGERWLKADVQRIRFAPQSDSLVAFGELSGLRAWDMSRGCRPSFDRPSVVDGKSMRDIDVSPDGKLVALVLMDEKNPYRTGSVALWDAAEGKLRNTLPPASKRPAWRVRFSPDGKRLAAGSNDGRVTIWNVETGDRPAWGHWPAHGAWMLEMAFTADGKRLATAGADWEVKLWDLPETDEAPATPLAPRAKWGPFGTMPASLDFSPDGRRLLIGHAYCDVWDVDEGKPVRRLPGSWAKYAPDGKTLATGGGELYNAARIWDAETFEERARMIGGHHYGLKALTFSPNGRRLLTGSADPAQQSEGVIRCWEAGNGKEIFDFSGCCD